MGATKVKIVTYDSDNEAVIVAAGATIVEDGDGICSDDVRYGVGIYYNGDFRGTTGLMDASEVFHAAPGILDALGAYAASGILDAAGVYGGLTGVLDAEGVYHEAGDYYTDPDKAAVKVGSDYIFAGVAQTASYPTTETSKAEQLADDVDVVEAVEDKILVGTTVLGVAGTAPMSGGLLRVGQRL